MRTLLKLLPNNFAICSIPDEKIPELDGLIICDPFNGTKKKVFQNSNHNYKNATLFQEFEDEQEPKGYDSGQDLQGA